MFPGNSLSSTHFSASSGTQGTSAIISLILSCFRMYARSLFCFIHCSLIAADAVGLQKVIYPVSVFLCSPFHIWDAVVKIVFQNRLSHAKSEYIFEPAGCPCFIYPCTVVLFICEIPGFQFPFYEQADLYCPLPIRFKKLQMSPCQR